MNLGWALGGFATDVIMNYCFATDSDCVGAPGFDAPFPRAIEALSVTSHYIMHFAWAAQISTLIPIWLMRALNPGLASFFDFQEVC